MWLRQSTAGQEILLGPFLDSTDGNTAETGLTIANTDIKIWKEGATTEANKNSGGATHIASGRYYAVLDATDSNTLGKLEVNVHVSGALAVRREFMVLPANVYDSLVLGTDNLEVDSTLIEGGDATDAINAACDTALSDYDAPTKTELDSGFSGLNDLDAAGIRTAIGMASANLDTQLGALPTAAENRAEMDSNSTQLAAIVADTNELQTDNIPGTLATIAGYLDTEIAAIKAVTDNLPDSGALTTIDGNIDSILTDTSTTLPATLSTIAGYIDTEVSAIKAKTDSLTFTVSGQVDANIQYVNDVAVGGTGADGDEWGPV